MGNATWNPDSFDEYDLVFSKHLFPLRPGDVYHFELYTLPKPDFERDPSNYRSHTVEVPANTSSDWVTTISVNVTDAEQRVLVTFDSAPKVYGFTHYAVQLFIVDSQTGNLQIVQTKNVSEIHTLLNFTDVMPGNYQIYVSPHDPFFYDLNYCLCKKTPSECQRCATTKSHAFEVKYIPTTTTTSVPTIVPETDPTDETVKVVFAVLGSLLGLVVVIIVAFVMWSRHCRNKEEERPNDNWDNNRNNLNMRNAAFDADSVITSATYNNAIGNPMKTLEKEPKLFLLFEDDHQYHKKVVDLFATYLTQHCHCKVMHAEWHLDAPWVHQEMQSADYRIIINSHGSYLTYENSKQKKNPSKMQASINSIHKSFLCDERYDKTVMVFFGYTDEEFVIPDICPGYKYKMMKNFPEFLMHIHNISRTDNMRMYDLPLDGNHKQRPIGQKLLEAIEQATRYEKENPSWYMKRFGILRTISHISDQSQFDSGLPEESVEPPVTANDQTYTQNNEQQARLNDHAYTELDMQQERLRQYFGDQDMITISPSILEALDPPQKPQLKNLEPLQMVPQTEIANTKPSPTTGDSGVFFIPPDLDMDEDFDVQSKTISEQLVNINEQYNHTPMNPVTEYTGYNRNSDLALLQITGLMPDTIELDSYSLGGESV